MREQNFLKELGKRFSVGDLKIDGKKLVPGDPKAEKLEPNITNNFNEVEFDGINIMTKITQITGKKRESIYDNKKAKDLVNDGIIVKYEKFYSQILTIANGRG